MGKVAAHMHWCEDWEFCTEYERGDVVRRGGLLWLCLQQNAGNDPRDEFNRNYWMPFAGDGGGEGTLNHEELLNRLGKGDDGASYHLAAWQHKILVQVALIPDDGNTYGIKYNAQTNTFMWVPVTGGGGGTGVHNETTGKQGGDAEKDEFYHLDREGYDKVDQLKNNAPDRPYNVSPQDLETDVTERPLFLGSDYHHPYNYAMLAYQLVITDDAGAVVYDTGSVETTVGQHQLAAGILSVNSTYKWCIRYMGTNKVWSPWSEATEFVTETVWTDPLILQPLITTPGNGSTVASVTPLIVTTPYDLSSGLTQVPGDFVIASDPGFASALYVVDQGTGLNSYVPATPLTRNTEYYVKANHKGKDGSGNVTASRFSPRVSFFVRGLYRETRIGIVWEDTTNWLFRRIDRNFNQVDLDGEFFSWHPLWAMLEATRDQLIAGQAMSALQKFWMYSLVAPTGQYAGKKVWMLDTEAPGAAELALGWHLHGAFISDTYGEQDHLLLSRGNMTITGGVATATQEALAGAEYNEAAAASGIEARNTDPTDPLKRGWHATRYYTQEAIKLLMLIEEGALGNIQRKYMGTGTTMPNDFHGLYLTPNVAPTLRYGFEKEAAMLPGRDSATRYKITPTLITPGGTNTLVTPNDLYRDEDGPEEMHLGDYFIGIERAGAGVGVVPDGSRYYNYNIAAGNTNSMGRMGASSNQGGGFLGGGRGSGALNPACHGLSKWS